MYYPYFIAYMMVGLVIGLSVFFWALKTGQFKDQARARFLPLDDDRPPQALADARDGGSGAGRSRFYRLEVWGLFLLVCAGLAATASVLAFALLTGTPH